jgi:NADH oxidase (H2O2-forming)
MKKADVVIIGGSAAGPVAGITARRQDKNASVLVIRKEAKVMIPCGIPYIFGTLGSPDKNVIPNALLSKEGIEIMVDEVTSIDKEERSLTTIKGETVAYGKLIIATGSVPVVPSLQGIDLANVFVMWKDADYLDRVRQTLVGAKDVVVIGGGFIGVEMADECKKLTGGNVTIVEVLPHCLAIAMDKEFCEQAEERLAARGVKVNVGTRVEALTGEGKVQWVELNNGEKLKADVVIVGIGSEPNTNLAEKAGFRIGELKGIWVDECMRTSDKNVFACGDCAEKTSFFTKKPTNLRLASIATFEARIAGANAVGLKRRNPGVVGVFATGFGDFAVAAAGLRESAAAVTTGHEIVVGEAVAADRHPGSMPGAQQTRVKLIFDKQTKRLIGGEVSGGATTAEIGNMMGMAIQTGMTAEQLALLQIGTHPALTCSPIAYQLVNAAELAAIKMNHNS